MNTTAALANAINLYYYYSKVVMMIIIRGADFSCCIFIVISMCLANMMYSVGTSPILISSILKEEVQPSSTHWLKLWRSGVDGSSSIAMWIGSCSMLTARPTE